ncbi:group 3 secretory phospholipase A2 [Echinops telfairi]|uniref:Group 3 secretory phospholipase A2 n=1 Tax=Echinops telfairi TaxID=9371 RepID=A0AC55D173_ECHTE|nr:group 3 secretory phospholipase A2 [Echinops telfairi]
MRVLGVLLGVLGFLGVALGNAPVPHWDSTFCHLAGPLGGPLAFLSFLAKDAGGLALFHTRWDGHGRLQACSRQDSPKLIAAFRTLCAQETTRATFTATPRPELQTALNTLQSQWEACQLSEELPAGAGKKQVTRQSEASGRGHHRAKRGWTMPGTLWCGIGDSASNSSELGLFQGPDLCCKEHDHCPQTITPLQYAYGIRNYRFHTISHCDCDAKFRGCLQNQHDSISDLVGVTFFNVLDIPCFLLEQQEACVAWYWWGGCKTYGSASLARLQPRTLYNISRSPTLRTSPSPPPTTPQWDEHPQKWPLQLEGPKDPSRVNVTALRPVISQHPQVLVLQIRLQNRKPPLTSPTSHSHVCSPPGLSQRQHRRPLALPGVPQGPGIPSSLCPPLGAHWACRSFRRLDRCSYQIGPQETKFQLLNRAHQPLFHCNCTRRLARFLRRHNSPPVTSRLLGLLSQTCFRLAPVLDCAERRACPGSPRAIEVSARHLQRLQLRLQILGAGVEEGSPGSSEHPEGLVTFFEQCRRLTQAARSPRDQWKSSSQHPEIQLS